MDSILRIFIKCLILTIIIELLVAIIIGIRKREDIINILLVNIMTNPLINSVGLVINLNYGIIGYRIYILIIELINVFVEGFIYKKYLRTKKINPYLLSFILNLSSFGLGEIINYIFK